jgi:hypothetical protein
VSAFAESSTALRVSWSPPPENKQNGLIAYYKIFYVPKSRSDSEATVVVIKSPAARDFLLDDLMKWTDYRLWMLAGTSVGDGPKSTPIEAKTDEDGMYAIHHSSGTGGRGGLNVLGKVNRGIIFDWRNIAYMVCTVS